jgi:hypothetical protein
MAREATHGAGVPRRHRTGSRRVERTGSGGGLRKLLPLLLGLLLAVVLALLLISLIGDDDGDEGGTTGSDAGQLTVGNTQLLPPPENGLSSQAGKTAIGRDVVVQSVNGNEGFFVGSSATERVWHAARSPSGPPRAHRRRTSPARRNAWRSTVIRLRRVPRA